MKWPSNQGTKRPRHSKSGGRSPMALDGLWPLFSLFSQLLVENKIWLSVDKRKYGCGFFLISPPSNETSWHLLCYSGINPAISASLQRKSLVALGFICNEKRPSWGKNTSLLIPKNIKDKISGLLFSTHLSLPPYPKEHIPFSHGELTSQEEDRVVHTAVAFCYQSCVAQIQLFN